MLHICIHQLLYLDPSSQLSIDALQPATPTAKSSTRHIYRRQMDHPVNQSKMLYIQLHQLLYLIPYIQLSIDALHTATPTAKSSTIHIYIEGRWIQPSQSSIDALHTTTPTVRSSTMHI